jgi:hypothetical protein
MKPKSEDLPQNWRFFFLRGRKEMAKKTGAARQLFGGLFYFGRR